jgi:methylenetetrahydrofolate--tRNA-(uracil-5-)-methyltransferase
MDDLTVIGGGLAGSEAAWQAAQQGIRVTLFEMRPVKMTGAHTTTYLSELVCSNSLGSNLVDRASGLLKEELRSLGSLLLNCAEKTSVPAGGALAVDRNAFALLVTEKLDNQKNITIVREEVTTIPDGPTIIATGPLTSQGMANAIKGITGSEHLYFYDAIAPVLFKESINQRVVFRASRYNRGEEKRGDYLNCPLDKDQYYEFIAELRNAERFWLKEFERELDEGVIAGAHKYFEGCLPVEIIAQRGKDALAYGPMRPVGLIDPHTGKRPYAVVQLRQDNLVDTLYNMVGFQTNLKYTEQKRILCMIPGLKNARFARYGQMHRNTFIYSPACLRETLQFIGKNILGILPRVYWQD